VIRDFRDILYIGRGEPTIIATLLRIRREVVTIRRTYHQQVLQVAAANRTTSIRDRMRLFAPPTRGINFVKPFMEGPCNADRLVSIDRLPSGMSEHTKYPKMTYHRVMVNGLSHRSKQLWVVWKKSIKSVEKLITIDYWIE